MSLINELRTAEAAYEAAQARLTALRENPQLKTIQEFETALRALLGKYSMSLKDVNHLLDPAYKEPKTKAPGKAGKSRSTRLYTNPHTGEVVDYYGGVNKILEEWREKWGVEEVKKWGVLNK
jgi:hypothetical protein